MLSYAPSCPNSPASHSSPTADHCCSSCFTGEDLTPSHLPSTPQLISVMWDGESELRIPTTSLGCSTRWTMKPDHQPCGASLSLSPSLEDSSSSPMSGADHYENMHRFCFILQYTWLHTEPGSALRMKYGSLEENCSNVSNDTRA